MRFHHLIHSWKKSDIMKTIMNYMEKIICTENNCLKKKEIQFLIWKPDYNVAIIIKHQQTLHFSNYKLYSLETQKLQTTK